MMEVIKPWLHSVARNKPICDLGCGAGELLFALSEMGFSNLSGCDISSEQVLIAKRKFPEVMQADLFLFLQEQPDKYFEVIIMFDVIEHLTKQEAFDLLQLINKKLSIGGMLIGHTPNGLSPFVGHVLWGDITHQWCLTPLSAQTLCKLFGLENFEAIDHLGAGRGIAGLSRRLLWKILKGFLQIFNLIETGSSGGSVWTRNFAFKANKSF
ncbi:MAG: class I SAM-dependent methyltransferase [Flavitalea sp.]